MLTVSIELAKKMATYGRSKECEYNVIETKNWEAVYHSDYSFELTEHEMVKLTWYAPTAQEILDELPILKDYRLVLWSMSKWERIVEYERNIIGKKHDSLWECDWDTLAEALWQLRCWCKENGYLDSKDKTDA